MDPINQAQQPILSNNIQAVIASEYKVEKPRNQLVFLGIGIGLLLISVTVVVVYYYQYFKTATVPVQHAANTVTPTPTLASGMLPKEVIVQQVDQFLSHPSNIFKTPKEKIITKQVNNNGNPSIIFNHISFISPWKNMLLNNRIKLHNNMVVYSSGNKVLTISYLPYEILLTEDDFKQDPNNFAEKRSEIGIDFSIFKKILNITPELVKSSSGIEEMNLNYKMLRIKQIEVMGFLRGELFTIQKDDLNFIVSLDNKDDNSATIINFHNPIHKESYSIIIKGRPTEKDIDDIIATLKISEVVTN